MPSWTVNEPDLSFWLGDLPLFYQPSRGPQIRFELLYKDGTDSTGEEAMSQQFMFGEHWSSPWRCYILTNSGGAVVFVNGLGGQTTLAAGTPTYRYELTFGATNGVPWIDSPSGARDVFGQNLTDTNGHTRSYLTQRYDPSGNAVQLQYSTTNSGTVLLLDRIIDAGGLTNTFAYTNTGAYFMVSKITDPFNATALFEYDYDNVNPPQLTAITDAIQLRTTISFDGQTLQWITPYGTSQVRKFFTTDLTYGAQMAALVTELGVRTNLYAYGDIVANVSTNLSAMRPSTTNGSVFSFPNTFDSANSNTRGTFHWGPRQYAALSSGARAMLDQGQFDFTQFTAADYRVALQRHWLIVSDGQGQESYTRTLSFERAPSPDGTVEGQITWYDYVGKTNAAYQGTMSLPRFVGWKLPNGESRFVYTLRNSLGAPTNIIETWNDNAGNLKVRTNILIYATNNVDLLIVTNALAIRVSSNYFNAFHQVITNYSSQPGSSPPIVMTRMGIFRRPLTSVIGRTAIPGPMD